MLVEMDETRKEKKRIQYELLSISLGKSMLFLKKLFSGNVFQGFTIIQNGLFLWENRKQESKKGVDPFDQKTKKRINGVKKPNDFISLI